MRPKATTRMICMQLSTSVHRWPDDLLARAFQPSKGYDLEDVRMELRRLEADGIEVFDCGRHRCDEKGRCTGEPILRLDRAKIKG